MNHDNLCYDKNKTAVKEGDRIRISTCGSLDGEFAVTRGANGELQVGGHDLFGFYPGTYEVLPNAPAEGSGAPATDTLRRDVGGEVDHV